MIRGRVEQRGNTVTLDGAAVPIEYIVDGIDLPPINEMSFAVWHLLPTAMRKGQDLHIEGCVDAATLANAERLARAWAMWVPGRYHRVKVSADTTARSSRPDRPRDSLIFFSGGIDSSYHMLERGPRSEAGYVLTMLNEAYASRAALDQLAEKTAPLLAHLNYRRIAVRTNARDFCKPAALMHGFTLAGCAFLLSDLFPDVELAADYSWEQDVLVFPWGTNHVTNRYFASSDFAVHSVTADVTRTEKMPLIAASDVAQKAVSFCVNKAARPHNCGRCTKCVRTKGMFLASTGALPPSFRDVTWRASDLLNTDMSNRKDRTFMFDLYDYAKRHDRLHLLPGIEPLIRNAEKPWRRTAHRYAALLRERIA